MRLRQGRSLVEQGLLWPYLGVVVEGVIQAVLTGESGREHALFDVVVGEVVGESSFLDAGPSLARYVAEAALTRVALIPAVAVKRECTLFPGLAANLSECAIRRTRSIVDRFSAHLALSSAQRVAGALLQIAAANEVDPNSLALREMTQVQMARAIGSVREVVQRVLSAFQQEGIVQLERGRVVGFEPERLRRVAETSPSSGKRD